MFFCAVPCFVASRYVALYCVMQVLRYGVMLCYAMLCYAMLCYAMLCHAMLCYVMLCYVMLYCACYVVQCYVMLCCVMLLYVLYVVTNHVVLFCDLQQVKMIWKLSCKAISFTYMNQSLTVLMIITNFSVCLDRFGGCSECRGKDGECFNLTSQNLTFGFHKHDKFFFTPKPEYNGQYYFKFSGAYGLPLNGSTPTILWSLPYNVRNYWMMVSLSTTCLFWLFDFSLTFSQVYEQVKNDLCSILNSDSNPCW